MYLIFKRGKKLTSLGKYMDYEQARQAARKFIRATEKEYEHWWDNGGNPSLSVFGYTIKQVLK